MSIQIEPREEPTAFERGWTVFSRAIRPVTITSGQMRMTDWWDETIGAPLWSKQREIMDAVDDHRFTAVASAVGIGKSETMAATLIAFLHTRPHSIAITTAPTANLVKAVLWRYIRRIKGQYDDVLLGRALTTEYQIDADWYAIGFKAADTEADRFAGFHPTSGHILTIIDEAQGVSDAVIDVLHNTMSSRGARFVMTGNPTSLAGRFREAFHEQRDTFHTISIPVYDSPNFTDEGNEPRLRFLQDVLTTQEFVQEEIDLHGWDSDYVRGRIRALWPQGTTNTLIALSDLEATEKQAGELYSEAGRYYAGVDVARFGDDESSISVRFGQEEIAFAAWQGNDTTETATKVVAILSDLERHRGWIGALQAEVRVDTIGVGGGVADTLRHWENRTWKVRDVNVSESSSDKTQWKNLRHELWWQMKLLYQEHRIAPSLERWDYTDITKPKLVPLWDRKMIGQMSNIQYKFAVGYEKPEIEAKDKMKKRTGMSPDRAEAQMLCYGQLPRKPGAPGVVAQGKARTRR